LAEHGNESGEGAVHSTLGRAAEGGCLRKTGRRGVRDRDSMPGLTAAEITVEITPEVLTVSTRPREALRTTIAISPTGAGSMRRRPRPRGDVSSRWP